MREREIKRDRQRQKEHVHDMEKERQEIVLLEKRFENVKKFKSQLGTSF